MTRPIRAVLRRNALVHNLGVLRTQAPRSRMWAVVKADAYGHGLLRLLPALDNQPNAPDGLALLELDAAIRLRDAGYRRPVLLLEGFFGADELPEFSRHGLTAVVHAMEQVALLEAATLPQPLDIYLKINTGMNRLGLSSADVASALQRLRACRNAGAITLMSHFADADGDSGVAEQYARLTGILAGLGAGAMAGGGLAAQLPISLANSAAILRYPRTHADWVRPGIALYGCTPFADEPHSSALSFGLEPVMTLESELIAIQNLRPGDRVGYGGAYSAAQSMRVGVVACGYADGYPRHAPGSNARGTPILVNGLRTRTVGRVSMDMLLVDLAPIPDAAVGMTVTLWGDGLSTDEVAEAAGTVSYELLCALAPRVPVQVIE